MRIASLLPSTTEIVCALGLGDQLVAVSHACDYPPEVATLPRATHPVRKARRRVATATDRGRRAAGTTPMAAETAAALASSELGGYTLDTDVIRSVRPDLVLVGDSGSAGAAQAAVRDLFGDSEPAVVSFDPLSLEGVFHSITTIGAMSEAEDEAVGLLEMLREDLGRLEEQAVRRRDAGVHGPRIVFLEGIDPPIAAGRWIPDIVRRSGGWELLGRDGEREAETTWEAVFELEPQMLFVCPDGLHFDAAQRAFENAPRPGFWHDLDAVERGDVFIVEPVYFCRPGPRIVGGVGMLAEIFDPDGFVDTSPPYSWTPLFE